MPRSGHPIWVQVPWRDRGLKTSIETKYAAQQVVWGQLRPTSANGLLGCKTSDAKPVLRPFVISRLGLADENRG